MDHIRAYEAVVPHYSNIHDDDAAAAAAGFSQPFASGTMIVAYTIERLLPDIFGEGWSHAGALGVTFTRPIVADDRVLLSADVVAKLPRGDDTEIVMQLKAILPGGELVAIGSASAIARG